MIKLEIVLLFYSCISAILLASMFIINIRSRQNGGIYLGLFILLISFKYFISLMYSQELHFILIPLSVISITMAGIVLINYISEALANKVSRKQKTLLLLGASPFLALAFIKLNPNSTAMAFFILYSGTYLLYCTYYCFFSIKNNYSLVNSKLSKWFYTLCVLGVLLAFNHFLALVIINIYVKLIMTSLFLIAMTLFTYQSLYQYNSVISIYKSSLDMTTIEVFKSNLDSIINSNESLIFQPNLNLTSFSKHMDIGKNELSSIINKHYKKNFQQFINSLRVRKALKLLHEKQELKIAAIAFEVGFSSLSSFYSSFKSETGHTPNYYRKKNSEL